MTKSRLLTTLALSLAACSDPSDPAAGGPGPEGAVGPDGAGGAGLGNEPVGVGAPTLGVPAPPGVSVQLAGQPEHYRFVRLTHEQWEHSVRDLLRLPADPGLSNQFVPDPSDTTFPNNERSLAITTQLWADYARVAEELAASVTSDPTALGRLTGTASDAASFVGEFGRRAFRRPLTTSEQTNYEGLFNSAPTLSDNPDSFAGGVELVVEAMLQSPHFLYRSELGAVGAPLSGHEAATKLSLLLRNTIPDDQTLAAAASGSLDTPAGVVAEAERLLALPDAVGSIQQFHTQLFRTFRYPNIAKDSFRFPNYDASLNDEFLAADLRFFDYVFEANLGLGGLLQSNVGFVSQATAPLYGATAPGTGLTQVNLADRPGYFTRLGFLALNGTLAQSDPIHRGVTILSNVLCVELMPPPIDIPPLPPETTDRTNRERIDSHTGVGTCGAACHAVAINPLGFAFENFDALGAVRELDNGFPVDTSGSFDFAGVEFQFNNAVEMLAAISTTPQAHACYAKHVSEFVLARDLGEADSAAVYALGDASLTDNASLKDLIMNVIQSPSFIIHAGGSLP